MTRRPPALLLVLALLATGFTIVSAVVETPAEACGPNVEAVRVGSDFLCTHGNDEPPAGVDTTELPSVDELMVARFGTDEPEQIPAEDVVGEPTVAAAGTVKCVGNGTDGARVQLVYAHASNQTSRYGAVLPLLRQYASDADDILNVSAGRVGDGRRIRFVTNEDCLPVVLNVTLSRTGDDGFGNMVTELRNMGLDGADRKYLVFADAAVGICGLGEVYTNDRADQDNPNNVGRAMYARVDTSCWQHAAAHELLHTLGAVQNSAPNSTGAGHCTDEVDVMCYRDKSTTVTRLVCDRAGQVDCNNNDYYHPNPRANSYLATRWNVARSRYLASDEAPPVPTVTTVNVPTSGYAGVSWPVSVSVPTSDATVVWSSTRSQCWFANPRAKSTTWTCPATNRGGGEIMVTVTENGITTPFTTAIQLIAPTTKKRLSVNSSLSSRRVAAGQLVSIRARFYDLTTGAPVVGLPVAVEARDLYTTDWRTIARTYTNRNGFVRGAGRPYRHKIFRVRSLITPTWATDLSFNSVSVRSAIRSTVNQRLVAGLTRTVVDSRDSIGLGGQVSPNKAGQTISLYRYYSGRWNHVSSKRLTSTSRYWFRYTPRRDGRLALRVIKPADRVNSMSSRILRFYVD